MVSIQDYTDFHGMFIRSSRAARCIDALNGVILFMPQTYREKGLAFYEVKHLNLIKYYFLVIPSTTGLSTMLGFTKFIEAKENLLGGVESPEITPDILDYIHEQAQCEVNDLKIVRRFHYKFKIPGIDVKMFHVDDGHKLHLVEIVNCNKIVTSLLNLYVKLVHL